MSNNIFTQQDSYNVLGLQHNSLSNIFDFDNEDYIHNDYNQSIENQYNHCNKLAMRESFEMIQDQHNLQEIHRRYQQNFDQQHLANQVDMSLENLIFSPTFLNKDKPKDISMLGNIEQERSSEFSSHNTSSQFSVQNCLNVLENKICLRTTPIHDINVFLKSSIEFPSQSKQKSYNKVLNLILKKKMILKREKAKGRREMAQLVKKEHFEQSQMAQLKQDNNGCTQKQKRSSTYVILDQEKRKRNRISAQVSRDRRKNYLNELQKVNQKLKQDYADIEMENIRLKKQLQTVQRQKKIHQRQNNGQKTFVKVGACSKSKMNKLLILLGIIFLIGSLKSMISPQKSIVAQLKETNCFSNKKQEYMEFPQSEKQQIIQGASFLMSQEFDRLSINPNQNEVSNTNFGRKRRGKVQEANQQMFQQVVGTSKAKTDISLPNQMIYFIQNFFTMLPSLKSQTIIPVSLYKQLSVVRGAQGRQQG